MGNGTSRHNRGAGARVVRQLAVVLIAGAVAGTAMSGPASASTPQRLTRTVGPIVSDAPAGTLCDFDYHEEDSFTWRSVRFFDDTNHLVRAETQVDLTVLHRNTTTGKTLVEEVHHTAHVDLITGQVRQTGQTWHLRDEDGRLVLSGAGLIVIDIATGEVIDATPHTLSDAGAALCPLLGGTAV